MRGDRVSWLDQLAERLDKKEPKSAVEEARARHEYSLFDQITSIVDKPRYSSVEHAVQDLQERTGLTAYLSRMASNETVKQAQDFPQSWTKFDENTKESILSYIKNTIDKYHGAVIAPAIQEELVTIFNEMKPADAFNAEVTAFLKNQIEESNSHRMQEEVSGNLGKGNNENLDEDDANTNFFKALLPPTD